MAEYNVRMAGRPETLSSDGSSTAHEFAPHLFLLLNSDHPGRGSLRLSLQGIDRVDIQRAEGGEGPKAIADGKAVRLLVADAWMSTLHATLRRVLGVWSLEDNGSRNGTFIDGRSIRRSPLSDGDLIEAGHTFFLFRERLAVGAVPERDARPAGVGFETLVPALASAFGQVETVARTPIPVVICGETGTGKELVAYALHALSGRKGPFQPVNCASLSSPQVQSELFGHCQGASGSAAEEHPGLIRAAEGGTLFLDEFGELPSAAQSLLLRTLQDGEVFPVGASRPVKVDVRVVAATNRALDELASGSRFRADLLARMAGLTVRLPALRERREDMGVLIRSFLTQPGGCAPDQVSFTCEALRAILLHRWPFNVRELEKTVKAAAVLAKGSPIALEDLPPNVRAAVEPRAGSRNAQAILDAGDSYREQNLTTPNSRLQRFIDEISRRHVVRVVVAYGVAVFGALQGADVIVTRLSLPSQWMVWLVIASLVGLPVSAVLSWVYDWTHAGIVRTQPLGPDHRSPARVRRRQRRKLALALLLLAALTAGGMIWWRGRPSP